MRVVAFLAGLCLLLAGASTARAERSCDRREPEIVAVKALAHAVVRRVDPARTATKLELAPLGLAPADEPDVPPPLVEAVEHTVPRPVAITPRRTRQARAPPVG